MDFMPEPAPTVQQLLAFYLEAGVDCALGDAPVDRLAESDSVAVAAAPREIVPPRPAREIPAAMPAAPRADAALAPDEAISSAREAARTAPSLEALRQLYAHHGDGIAERGVAGGVAGGAVFVRRELVVSHIGVTLLAVVHLGHQSLVHRQEGAVPRAEEAARDHRGGKAWPDHQQYRRDALQD